jgi:hypothetical protein
MPKVAASHLLEARAVTRVQLILAESNALSEVVKNDYGEDLIVQTEHMGEADPFQILVQVKGSGSIGYAGRPFSRRFRVDHLYRWVVQSGSVLVCVYDDISKRVFAFSPKERFSLWKILTAPSKTLSIKLSEGDEFTAVTARDAIWKARIEHISGLLALGESRQQYFKLHGVPKRVMKDHQREIALICLLFLRMIGMVAGDEFCDSVRKQIRNGAIYFTEQWGDEDWSLRHIMMFALIGEVNEVTGCGVPSNIMEQVTEAAGHFYKAFHPNEWHEAERHMRLVWTPYSGMAARN